MNEHITITRSEAYDLLNDLMELERCMSFMAHQVSACKALALGYARQAERVKARRLALLKKLEGENS